MKISVENLGVLKQAEFELGEMTLICGSNNTGKTYATYALYGFLSRWSQILEFDISNSEINSLLDEGVLRIDIASHIDNLNNVLTVGCQNYSRQLPRIFAAKADYFKNSHFQVELQPESLSIVVNKAFERKIGLNKTEFLSLVKKIGEKVLIVSLLVDLRTAEVPPTDLIKDMISSALAEIILDHVFPEPFIASIERTGAAIFRKELNFARNRLLEEMTRVGKDIDPMELLFKSYNDYALPVKANADFIRQLETTAKEDSVLAKSYPRILNDFSDIIGGEYIAGSNDTIYFKPSKSQLKFTMGQSSSAVRSLLDLGFYLHHVAKIGDLLMVDEPELNLHPENQRRVARLFAQLVNIGIKVFITTHSDYIVKELNSLIMLNHDRPYLKRIAKQEGYRSNELLSANKVKVYIAEKASIKLKNNVRRSQCQTLVKADVNTQLGIEARSFDETINKMNEIQDAIIWGDDE